MCTCLAEAMISGVTKTSKAAARPCDSKPLISRLEVVSGTDVLGEKNCFGGVELGKSDSKKRDRLRGVKESLERKV